MPINSYLCLLVLTLAVSTVSPVRCANPQQVEDRTHTTSSAPPSGSRHHARAGKGLVYLGLGLTSALLTVALITTFYPDSGKKQSATRPIPPTNTTQTTPPPQPNNPPRDFVGREERDPAGGFAAVDTSSEPYPNLHRDHIANGVFTTPASSEARSLSDQDWRTLSSLSLLSRADLEKELIISSRVLDKID